MKAGQEPFATLITEAYVGKLRLPGFQRDFEWRQYQVVSLFDSIRKGYPIGGFLFMKTREDFDLSPRPFSPFTSDAPNLTHKIERYVLDGQQRLTAGLRIYRGVGDVHLFLDLDQLWQKAEAQSLDVQNEDAVIKFSQDLDDDDEYCISKKSGNPKALIKKHLFWSAMLTDDTKFQNIRDDYVEAFPERAKFMDYLIRPHFRLGTGIIVPVTTLDQEESIEATTKIFATLNTTGKPLTPFEIVVARLFSDGFRLVQDVEENKEVTSYYRHMDQTGEIYLQTIALLAKQEPKKARLPRTITGERYKAYKEDAVQILEDLGEFLTDRLGVGLEVPSNLTPYDSMFPPMAIVLSALKKMKLKGNEKSRAERKIERWFVAAALSQRYAEGVHNKQQTDVKEMIEWLRNDKEQPGWLRNFTMQTLIDASPSGAIGRLIQCIMNREHPVDPFNHSKVGYYPTSYGKTEKHHVFPRKFCESHISDWTKKDNANQALNIIFTDSETNRRWSKMNPSDQVADIETENPDEKSRKAMLLKHGIDDECIEIMKRPSKTKADFEEFLSARERVFIEKFGEWNLSSSS